jgi:hypothetical protein
MLAPFATELLIACSILLFAGWANEVMAGWLGIARQATAPSVHRASDHPQGIEIHGFTMSGTSGLCGNWLFRLEHPERN